jgi:hypothetical protein
MQKGAKQLNKFQNLAKKLDINVITDVDLAEHIRMWFQSKEGGNVIITTRNHTDKSRGSVIHINNMVKNDALLLLLG